MEFSMKTVRFASLAMLALLLLTACGGGDGDEGEPSPTPEPGLEAVDGISLDLTRDWYVETTGDDDNFCTTVDSPCLTIRGALTQSTIGDRIHVGAGTFVEPGMASAILILGHSVSIIGAGPDATIIDANNAEGGIFLSPGTAAMNVHLEGFTIQNTVRASASGCIDNRSPSNLTVQNVEMRNCWRSGFSTTGTGHSHLIDVYIHDAIDEDTDPDFTVNGSGVETNGNLTIEGGEISSNPRNGILVLGGTLQVAGTSINGNEGDGVFIADSLGVEFDGVTINDNARRGIGSGLFIGGGPVTIDNSEFFDNVNGAIFMSRGGLWLSNSEIHNEPGRALHVSDVASAHIDEVEFINNGSAGDFLPIIWNSGILDMRNSLISGSRQISLYNSSPGDLSIFDSQMIDNRGNDAVIVMIEGSTTLLRRVLVANNQTGDQAAIEDTGGDLTAHNLTISNNSNLGVRSRAPFAVFHTTIAENGGYGATFQFNGGTLSDVIIANNDDGDCLFPIYNTLFPGTNIDTDASCNFDTTYSSAELLLGPLADNGGTSQTHALDPASPAVDAATGVCPPSDQRLFSRPGTPACDVGAYEISDTMIAIESLEFEEPETSGDLVEIFTPTPDGPASGTAIQNASCRKGTDAAFEVHNFLFEGEIASLVGRLADNSWYYLELPEDRGRCWVFAENLELSGAYANLPLFTPPELPAPDEGGGDDGGGNDGGGNNGGGGGGSAPDAPSNVNHQCTGGSNEFTIDWNDNSDNEDGFRIYVDGNQVGSVGPNVEKFTHDPGGSGPYVIAVEAYNGNGQASDSQNNVGCFG
jgi:hypothetical protein